MFTGIVTDVGQVMTAAPVAADSDGLRLRIGCDYDIDGIDIGASIACSGVCLTVAAKGDSSARWFEVDVSAETIGRTTIGPQVWTAGTRVNLERALRVGDELGGHIVLGHVDCVAAIAGLREEGESLRVDLETPKEYAPLIATKGSVALDGISLTVNEVDGSRFGVNIIPHTRLVTTWAACEVGQLVNLEVDTLARYVARLHELR